MRDECASDAQCNAKHLCDVTEGKCFSPKTENGSTLQESADVVVRTSLGEDEGYVWVHASAKSAGMSAQAYLAGVHACPAEWSPQQVAPMSVGAPGGACPANFQQVLESADRRIIVSNMSELFLADCLGDPPADSIIRPQAKTLNYMCAGY